LGKTKLSRSSLSYFTSVCSKTGAILNVNCENGDRVTRLGKFSPIGWLFAFGELFENYKSSPKFWEAFSLR
jgi:hypothetical protein